MTTVIGASENHQHPLFLLSGLIGNKGVGLEMKYCAC